MANSQHVQWFLNGVEYWNKKKNSPPYFVGGDLSNTNIGYDLVAKFGEGAVPSFAGIDLSYCNLRNTSFLMPNMPDFRPGLELSGADFLRARAQGAIFFNAKLVCCRTNSFTKSFDLCEDGISHGRPHKRMGVFVPVVCEAFNPTDQFLHLPEGPSSNRTPRDDIEPDLHLVEPARIGRREVELEAWVSSQPLLYLGVFVGGVVIDHQMEVPIRRHLTLDVA